MAPTTTGVLLMSYGTPRNLDEVEPYYRSIRGGRPIAPELMQELIGRYRTVGGTTPLLETTREIAEALESRLNQGASDQRYRAFVGMKHWTPFIEEAIAQAAAEGVQGLIAFPLAPHFSEMSIGGYRTAVEDATRSLARPLPVRLIASWYANPRFVRFIADRIHEALKTFPSPDPMDMEVIFSAHSLPRRIQQWNDPYPEELRQSAEAIARAAGLQTWRFSYQSAGRTADPWLGPDILETLGLGDLNGKKQVLVAPIGFVVDNLEIVYDLDVQARGLATEIGLEFRRMRMPNASPDFIEALADIVLHGDGARVEMLTAPQDGSSDAVGRI